MHNRTHSNPAFQVVNFERYKNKLESKIRALPSTNCNSKVLLETLGSVYEVFLARYNYDALKHDYMRNGAWLYSQMASLAQEAKYIAKSFRLESSSLEILFNDLKKPTLAEEFKLLQKEVSYCQDLFKNKWVDIDRFKESKEKIFSFFQSLKNKSKKVSDEDGFLTSLVGTNGLYIQALSVDLIFKTCFMLGTYLERERVPGYDEPLNITMDRFSSLEDFLTKRYQPAPSSFLLQEVNELSIQCAHSVLDSDFLLCDETDDSLLLPCNSVGIIGDSGYGTPTEISSPLSPTLIRSKFFVSESDSDDE